MSTNGKEFLAGFVLVSVLLSGCGGGGGGTSSGTMNNTVTIGKNVFNAGEQATVSASASMRGTAPTAMAWTVTSVAGASAASDKPSISDPNCANVTVIAPISTGASGLGTCSVVLKIPATANPGVWRISNTATANTGIITDQVDISIVTAPASTSGFKLTASYLALAGYVGNTIAMGIAYTANPGVTVSNAVYSWIASAANPATTPIIGATSATASIVPTQPGFYVFQVNMTADINGRQETSSGIVSVQVYPPNVADQVDAGTSQIATPGAVVKLTGSILNLDPTLPYEYSWTQLPGNAGGPAAVTLMNSGSTNANFIAPLTPGSYGFEFKVRRMRADGTLTTSTAPTTVVVQPASTGVFTVSAGVAQIAATSDIVTLTGSVKAQNSPTDVSYTYQWEQVGTSPAVALLADTGTLKPAFVPTVAGTYVFNLTVTATSVAGTSTVSAQTLVVVQSAPAPGFAMSADAGVIQSVQQNSVVSLVGTIATQGVTAGVQYAYSWTQVGAAPSALTISNANSLTAAIFPVVNGIYTLRLTVVATLGDGTTCTSSADTQVVVGALAGGFTVSAGDAQTASANSAVLLTGVVSTQGTLSGAVFSYQWTQTKGTTVTIANAQTLAASFVPIAAGTYTFVLTVTQVLNGVTSSQSSTTEVLVTAL